MPFIKKMIYSGKLLEIEKYPVSKKGSKIPKMGKYKVSSESQKNLNEKNSIKRFIRLIETNFTEEDMCATLTYKNGYQPETEEKARKNFQNFTRRLRYEYKKNKLPNPKYAGVTVIGNHRTHHHIFLKNYSWDTIKGLWEYGNVTIRKLERDDEYGFVQIGKYILSDKNKNVFKKRLCTSQNLEKPKVVYKEIKRINIYKKVEAPKGYKITDIEITDNIFTGMHQYIRCVKLEC